MGQRFSSNSGASDVSDFAPGTVDSTELGYLNGVTSAIQTQLNAKQAASENLDTFSEIAPTSVGQDLMTAATVAAARLGIGAMPLTVWVSKTTSQSHPDYATYPTATAGYAYDLAGAASSLVATMPTADSPYLYIALRISTADAGKSVAVHTNSQKFMGLAASASIVTLSNQGDILLCRWTNDANIGWQVLYASPSVWAQLGAAGLTAAQISSSAITGLGSAAASDTGDFATSTQGGKADSAVQPGDLGAVAFSNDYDDLDNKPAGGTVYPVVPGGRLTLESGVPFSTSDQTAKGTLYYTPHISGRVTLYSGSAWVEHTFTERSLSLTLTSGKNYDVFLYDNSGTLTLELSSAWTNDTTRADALTTQDGVTVKSGATTRLWLGTIRASGTNTCEDSMSKRFVWNAYHRTRRNLKKVDTTSSWTFNTNQTIRALNNSSANRVESVCGVAGASMVQLTGHVHNYGTTASGRIGFGVDSTSAYSTDGIQASSAVTASVGVPMIASLTTPVALGYHYYSLNESTSSTSNVTFYGVSVEAAQMAGITGSVEC